MADQQQSAQSTPSASLTGTPFVDKSGSEKIRWLGKCFVMLITCGFAYPNIWVE